MILRYHFRHLSPILALFFATAIAAIAQSSTDVLQVGMTLSHEQIAAGDTVVARLSVHNVGAERYEEVEWGIEQAGKTLAHGSIRRVSPGETVEKSTTIVLPAGQQSIKGWARLRDELAEPPQDRVNNAVTVAFDVKPSTLTQSNQ